LITLQDTRDVCDPELARETQYFSEKGRMWDADAYRRRDGIKFPFGDELDPVTDAPLGRVLLPLYHVYWVTGLGAANIHRVKERYWK
jgi:hypothetical protein